MKHFNQHRHFISILFTILLCLCYHPDDGNLHIHIQARKIEWLETSKKLKHWRECKKECRRCIAQRKKNTQHIYDMAQVNRTVMMTVSFAQHNVKLISQPTILFFFSLFLISFSIHFSPFARSLSRCSFHFLCSLIWSDKFVVVFFSLRSLLFGEYNTKAKKKMQRAQNEHTTCRERKLCCCSYKCPQWTTCIYRPCHLNVSRFYFAFIALIFAPRPIRSDCVRRVLLLCMAYYMPMNPICLAGALKSHL